MCGTCGCNVTHEGLTASDFIAGNSEQLTDNNKLPHKEGNKEAISVLKDLLSENDHQAMHNRDHFQQHGVLVINLMSSPGAGKTRLLEATIDALKSIYSIAVIEGDLETENDARRIRALGVEAVQICTGSACHLNAHMVHQALHQIDLSKLDILFIENVGNLVCPASFDLGQNFNVALLSVPEGDDKPAKYPVMFRAVDLVLITKRDLLPYLPEFSVARVENALHQLATEIPSQLISSKTGEGISDWLDWLKVEIIKLQQTDVSLHVHNKKHEMDQATGYTTPKWTGG